MEHGPYFTTALNSFRQLNADEQQVFLQLASAIAEKTKSDKPIKQESKLLDEAVKLMKF